MSGYVYILYSAKLDRYYVGSTNDVNRRLSEHNRKKGKYTDNGIPWVLCYTEEYSSRAEAYRRETEIKGKKSREYIESLLSFNAKG